MKFLVVISVIAALLCVFKSPVEATASPVVPEEKQTPSPYHLWAHLHWAWLHASKLNQKDALQLIQDYKSYDIPVGGTNCDSSWMTFWNNFQPNTDLFPDMGAFIKELHDENVRVIFWGTSMVNTDHPEYDMAQEKGFLVKNKWGVSRPVEWWHGYGGFLDYTNPDALAWWHGQMDTILDLGADGFKCDGTDPYILEYEKTGGAFGYNGTAITYRDYTNQYYGDFFTYTRAKRGDAGLVMARPVDCLLDSVSRVCWGYSPQHTALAAWVGDDDSTYDGLRNAAAKVIYSAWAGYPNPGFDIGGYRGHYGNSDVAIPEREVFLRWAALGAFLPLMENGGNGEHRPWRVGVDQNDPDASDDVETAAIYRRFVVEHHRLAPLLLTAGSVAQEQGVSQVTPLATRPPLPSMEALKSRSEDTADPRERKSRYFDRPDSFAYVLADALLVHPIVHGVTPEMRTAHETRTAGRLDAGVAVVKVDFPASADVWLDWWAPTEASKAHKGGSSSTQLVPLSSFPVWVKRGALLPLGAKPTEVPALGASAPVEFTWFSPRRGESATAIFREPVGSGVGGRCTGEYAQDTGEISMSFSAHAGVGAMTLVGVSGEDIQWTVSAGDMTPTCSVSRDAADARILRAVCTDMSLGAVFVVTGVEDTM